MTDRPGDDREKRDWRISAILLGIWMMALAIVVYRDIDIPASMMAMATVFFVLLIPAMNDMVRSIERYATGESADRNAKKENARN